MGAPRADTAHRLAYISGGDARNVKSWSGTPYYMLRALEKEFEDVFLPGRLGGRDISVIWRLIALRDKLTRRRSMPMATWPVSKIQARALKKQIAGKELEALVFAAASGPLASTRTKLPILYTSDTTVRAMRGYYPAFTTISEHAFRVADAIERQAITRATALLYPSDWAAQSAMRHYGAEPERVFIHPYGANIDTAPPRAEALRPRDNATLQLVFIGVDWARKGGPLVVEALQRLRAAGHKAHLTVIGTVPPEECPRDHMTVHPFLNKSNPEEARIFARVMATADLLFVPTRAECQGVVWCEAAAFGVPSITTDTGGVSGAVKEGATGHMLPPEAGADAYAGLIGQLVAEPGRLEALRLSARRDYEERLNWSAWAKTFRRAYSYATGQG